MNFFASIAYQVRKRDCVLAGLIVRDESSRTRYHGAVMGSSCWRINSVGLIHIGVSIGAFRDGKARPRICFKSADAP